MGALADTLNSRFYARRRPRALTTARRSAAAPTFPPKVRVLLALCDQGLVSVANFATALVVGRICGKADLGLYSLAWTLITLTSGCSSMLIITPYTVLGPQFGQCRRRRLLGSAAVHQLVLAATIALLIGGGASLALSMHRVPPDLATTVITTAVVIVFVSFRDFARGVSFAELRTESALMVDFAATTIQACGIACLLYFRALSVSSVLLAFGVSSAIAASAWLVCHRHRIRLDARLYAPDLKRTWALSRWVLGSALAWQSATYLYPWLLAAFHGPQVTGTWAACSAIVAACNPLVLGVNNHVGPHIANLYATSGVSIMARYIRHATLFLAAILLPLVLVLAVFGERLLTVAYGASYAGTGAIIALLAVNMLLIALAMPFVQGLFTLQCARADMYVNVISLIVLFAVGLPAVKTYAAYGAAATIIASSVTALALKILLLQQQLRQRPPQRRPAPVTY